MLDFIKKTMLTGIGIAMKTKDELEEWVKEIVKKGEMSENEGKNINYRGIWPDSHAISGFSSD